ALPVRAAVVHGVSRADDQRVARRLTATVLDESEDSAHESVPRRVLRPAARRRAFKQVVPAKSCAAGVQHRPVRLQVSPEQREVALYEAPLQITLHGESAATQQSLHLAPRADPDRYRFAQRTAFGHMAAPVIERAARAVPDEP